ncbi:MAG: VOC family protein [Pseudomonadota bacterium]
MAKIVGLGGVFFKSADPKDRKEWYAKHLGLHPGDGFDGVEMRWRRPDEDRQDMSLVSFFDRDTNYLGQGGQPFMLNFVVDDLDGMLTKLRADGCNVDDEVVSESYGKFGWLTDPDGVRIELWEPAGEAPDLSSS